MTFKGFVLAGTALALVGTMSPALAGGFQRSIADTDILFEKGTYASRLGASYVKPERGFESIGGVSGGFGNYTGSYGLPSVAFYVGSDAFGCAGNYVESFAAEADYDLSPGGALPRQVSATVDGLPVGSSNSARLALTSPTTLNTSRTINTEFDSQEFSGTCRASYSTETMRFSLLGGVFAEDFHFEGESFGERNLTGAFAGTPLAAAGAILSASGSQLILPSRVEVDSNGDYKLGFRVGASVEMPDIALRVQALYRSEVKHDDVSGGGSVAITDTAFVRLANGQNVSVPTFFSNPALQLNGVQRATIIGGIPAALRLRGTPSGAVIPVASSLNEATSPQYLQLNAQTGIAPGTLLLGSFRWTDWSTNESVISTISSTITGTSSSYSPYNWRDGYTASIGLGKAFNEQVSGAISLGYDRGVSTGSETTYTDLYTVSAGVSFKPASWSEIRLGGLIGFWSDGEQKISDGAYFNGTVGDDHVYGANASVKFTF